jgi:transposase
VDQVAAGADPEDVADVLGLHRKTVYGWLVKYREGGKDALRAKPVPGRPRKLSGPQIARLHGLIVGRDPQQMSFEFALWTREVIRKAIHHEFGVALSVVSVGRLLCTMGLWPQRPLDRAYHQNPEAVARWKDEEFPAVRAAAKAARATIYFADVVGIRSDYHSGTAQDSVNMLFSVSTKGALRFMVYEGTVNADVFIDFCKRLLRVTDGPVHLVVGGHPAYRAEATAEFIAATDGRLTLYFLPGYSPELNADG